MLIKLFGDPDALIADYKEQNKNKSLEREDEVDLVSIKSHKIKNNIGKNGNKRKDSTRRSDYNHINLTVDHKATKLSPNKQQSMRMLKNKDGDSELNFSVMSEMPVGRMLKENQEKLMYQPDSITMGNYKLRNKLTKNDERVLREIEKVRMRRQRRLEDKLFEEERKQMHQEKLKNKIKRELERRKVEHGIVPNSKKKFKKKNLIKETSTERDISLKRKPQVELYDFSLEEKKDKNDVHNFLRTYHKLFQHLFKIYANSGFSHKNINSFDAIHDRIEMMSLSEFTIMLKKNSVIPELIHKEEATTILRLVNAHITGDKMKGKSISSKHFPHLFLQVAMFVFGRDPINLSQKPPIESLKAFIKLFEKSAFQRGESTKLYENPDHTIIADNEMIRELNKILKKNPNHPMPEGFKRIKIDDFKPIYKIPDYMPIPEPKKIALEIVDRMLSKAFGFHIFEPINKPIVIYKAKPILKQLMKYPVKKQDVPFILALPPKGRKNLNPIPSKPYRGERSLDRTKK